MDRFWSKVQKSDACWIWVASRDPQGYGTFGFNGVVQKAHRVSYQLSVGPIPDGAPRSDNMRDKVDRGRDYNTQKTECIHGHPFNDDNTYVTPKGRRNCRTCRTAAKRAYRARLRATATANMPATERPSLEIVI